MLDDSLLLATFEEYKLEKTNIDILKNNPKFIKYLIARHRLIKRQGNAADINTLVMTVPSYIGIHTQKQKKRDSTVFYFYKDPKLTPIKETAIENTITRKIKTHADTLKLNISILGKSNLSDIETNTFNDYQQLTRWINERTGLGQLGIHTYNDQYMAPYIKQYRYLASCQVANINKMLYVSFIVFDLKTNGSKLSYHKLVKKCKPGSKKLDLIFYEMLHQVKQKPVQLDLLKKKYKIQYED